MTRLERFLIWLNEQRIYQDTLFDTWVGKKLRDLLAHIGHKRIKEAHLILPDELINFPAGNIVWVENRYSWGDLMECMPMLYRGIICGVEQRKGVVACIDLGNGDKCPVSRYGVNGWVWWNARPTDEQRKAVKWE